MSVMQHQQGVLRSGGVQRDVWGRYLIPQQTDDGWGPPVPHTRATTVSATLDDTTGLDRWRSRRIVEGLSRRPELLPPTDASDVDRDQVVREALVAGGGSTAADVGTEIHTAVEDLIVHGATTSAFREHAETVAATLAHHKLRPIAAELVVAHPDRRIAGTLDLIVEGPSGRRYVADLKTGAAPPQRRSGSWAVQLAIYATATHRIAETGSPVPAVEVDQGRGIILHCPARLVAAPTCELLTIDLDRGRRGFELACQVRDWRAETR